MKRFVRSGRGLRAAGLALAAIAVVCAALPALAQERHGVAVLPPRVDAAFASIQDGMREWLTERLRVAGVGVVDRKAVQRALARAEAEGQPVRTSADTPAIAAEAGAAMVLMSELRFEAGEVDLRLRLHDGGDGKIVTGVGGQGRVGELGEVARTALIDLLGQLEFTSARLESAPVPKLSDWSALGRARKRLDEADLVGAWRELSHVHGATADRMRGEIEAQADSGDLSPVQRSRLASVAGRPDRDWLRVRNALRKEESMDALLAAGDAAVARGDAAAALRFYDRAAKLEPGNADAQLRRAELLAEVGRGEEAAAAFRTVSELAPQDPRPLSGLAGLEGVPQQERAQHLMRAGELHADRLEADAARRAFQKASQLDGTTAGIAYKNVAKLDEWLGNHGEAVIEYEQAIEQGATGSDALVGLARTRAANGDLAGAELAYREALALGGDLPEAHRGLGELLVETGRSEEAIPHLARAVELRPGDARARRGLAHAHKAAGDVAAALQAVDPAALPPEVDERHRAGLMHEAAELHQEQGDLDEAELLLSQAVELEPDDPPLRTALALVYDAQGRPELAAVERTTVASLTGIEIAPTDGSAGSSLSADGAGPATVSSLAALVESFPPTNPKTGLPLERVHLVAIEERTRLEGTLRRLFFPRRPDLEGIELALLAAVANDFPVDETPEIPLDLEAPLEHLRDFGTNRETVATVNAMLESDAVFFARVSAIPVEGDNVFSPERLKLEVRLFGGASTDSVYILANTLLLGPDAGGYLRWNWIALGPWLLILALCVWPFVRGWGTVAVHLDYDTQAAKGFFNIRLSRRPGKAGVQKAKEGSSRNRQYQQKMRAWSRLARNMVDQETVFRLVPARNWYVAVYGLLQDSKTKEVIGNYLEERQVRLERGTVAKLEFDFRVKEAPVEVRVTRSMGEDEGVASDLKAVVSLRGQPETLRYLREGMAILHVPNGEHVVVVGCEDRVLEEQVLIQEFAGASLAFPIDRDEMAVFTGCPDAVEPYLAGDLPAASQALDQAGHTELANLLRAEFHKERGENAEAARYYQAAGRVQEAAELSAESEDVEGSATLFEQAGDFAKAGDQYRQAGELERAAAAYEAAYDYDSALDCFRQAGRHEKVADLCEKTGAFFDAAQAALELGDEDRAIRGLQQVDLRDPSYLDACKALADLFSRRGDLDLAIDRLGEAVSSAGDETVSLEMLEQLGDLLERASELERALEVFERIRKRDYAYEGAAERISRLREKLQSQRASESLVSGGEAVSAGAATQVAATPSRYEIVGELGRGGMGVVYRARDTRLGRIIALKRLPENLRENQTAVELFLREARAAAALNHPNIVTLFDADQEGDNYYITMEFLDGLPLDAILKKRGMLSARDVVRLGGQVCAGLQYAHEQKVVHRDIKTSNIFFTRERVVKIMDFGLAKMMEEVRKAATVIGGTPYYMAPEQAVGQGVDHRADLYALGVTFFELATGDVPYKEGDVTYHHRHTPAPDPRERHAQVPDALAELILHMMAKDKEERPASAGEVAARLVDLGASL